MRATVQMYASDASSTAVLKHSSAAGILRGHPHNSAVERGPHLCVGARLLRPPGQRHREGPLLPCRSLSPRREPPLALLYRLHCTDSTPPAWVWQHRRAHERDDVILASMTNLFFVIWGMRCSMASCHGIPAQEALSGGESSAVRRGAGTTWCSRCRTTATPTERSARSAAQCAPGFTPRLSSCGMLFLP